MGYFAGQSRKSYYAALLTAFYISLQAFVLLMDMGADYSDGLQLQGPRFHLRISPLASRSALRISVASQDAEFARELALSARDLARALEAGPGQNAASVP